MAAKSLIFLYLLFAKRSFQSVAADFDFDDFDSVEPVFEVFAIGNDAGAVPFADWFEYFVVRTGDEVVEAAGRGGSLCLRHRRCRR